MTVGPGIAPGLLVPSFAEASEGARGLVPPSLLTELRKDITAGGELHPALRTQAASTSDGDMKISPFRSVKQVFDCWGI